MITLLQYTRLSPYSEVQGIHLKLLWRIAKYVPAPRAKNMFTELPNPLSKVEPDQKWAEPFADLLDEIYFPGYAKNLAEESPETYSREYWYFMALYD